MIIAEIGQNWCGKPELAFELMRLAKENGADLVKFQLYDHEILYSNHPEIPDVSLTYDVAKSFFDYGASIGMEVFFSVFDIERVEWCERIGAKRYKIACGMRDQKLLDAVIQTGKPIIISSNNDTFYQAGFSWLYCVSEYPTSIEHIKMPVFNNQVYNKWQGFSDHTLNLTASKVALARGAQIIEKHFCLDHHTGIDAEWSMDATELRELRRWSDICQQIL